MAVIPTKRPVLSIKGKKGAKKVENNHNLSSVAEEITTPTDGANIREIRARIEDAFVSLGTDRLPGTIIPAGQRNNAAQAAEFVIADMLHKLAADRLKKATEAAENAGVFGDKSSYVSGDTVMVFSDPNFSINVKMGKPSRMIGREQVEAAAEKYLGRRASEFLEDCKKDRAATKQIIVSMK